MKPGTIVRLPDGREGTVVFSGLCGYGIKWGRHEIPDGALDGTVGDLGIIGVHGKEPQQGDDEWFPEAYLRDPWPRADLECVGEDYEIVEVQS